MLADLQWDSKGINVDVWTSATFKTNTQKQEERGRYNKEQGLGTF